MYLIVDDLKWEPARSGQPFPHLYGPFLRSMLHLANSNRYLWQSFITQTQGDHMNKLLETISLRLL